MVLWSHPADPGVVPSSWDTTDATKDAGQNDLPDVLAGIIRDALPLRGRMYVYKEGSTWRMTPVTGGYIFNFETLYETSGILTQRCVTITPDGSKHVVASQDDIIMHDGTNDPISLLSKRDRKYLFNQLDQTNYINSFMFTHYAKDEIWFCYPSSGHTNPDRALIFNTKDGGISEADITFRNVAVGSIQSPSATTWATASGSWDAYVGPWSTSIRRQIIACNTDTTKLLALDVGTTNDGTAITSLAQRTGLALVGRTRQGEPIVDFMARKQINRLHLKIQGGPVNVKIGTQELPDGAITWSDSIPFDPATQRWVDFAGSGQAIAVEVSAAVPWRMTGYKPEIEVISEF